jgi:hypothetical protein
MDPRDCRDAGTPTVQQHPVNPQRTVPHGAVSIIRLRGRHDPAEDEPHFGTGRGRRGGRSRLRGRPIVPPPGRATAANDTQHESNEDNAATSPRRREPVEQRRSNGTTPQDLSLRRRELLRGIHPKKVRDARLPVQVPSLVTRTLSRSSRATDHRRRILLRAGPTVALDRKRAGGRRHAVDAERVLDERGSSLAGCRISGRACADGSSDCRADAGRDAARNVLRCRWACVPSLKRRSVWWPVSMRYLLRDAVNVHPD